MDTTYYDTVIAAKLKCTNAIDNRYVLGGEGRERRNWVDDDKVMAHSSDKAKNHLTCQLEV